MKYTKAYTLFLFLFSLTVFSQFSKTHYIPPLSNGDSIEPQGQYLYISTPSVTNINFTINPIGGTPITGTVSRNTPYVYTIGSGYDTQLLISQTDVANIKNNKGYIIEAEDMVYVNVRMTATPQSFHAGGIVSKGLAALGTQFRIGAFTNLGAPNNTENHYTFATILATENNTTISFSDIKPGVTLINGTGNTQNNIVLNYGESFAIAVSGPSDENRDGLIGALISSDKPIAVNCGSIAGSNSNSSNLDLGFDQIVSAERTGREYIFIRGNGSTNAPEIEQPLIVAHEDGTEVYLNGQVPPAAPFATLNHGQYLAIDNTQFSANGNLFVTTSKNVFAYQSIGGSDARPNQNLHFLPPLSCQTPKIVDNIPLINEVGSNDGFYGTLNIVTKANAVLSFIINGVNYTLATLPVTINVTGPLAVTGNSNYVTYTIGDNLTGNISVISTEEVYVSFFGSSGAATFGGFYSGFTYKPEVAFQAVDITQSNCIPNVELNVSTVAGFDVYQWYFNGNLIPGANTSSYVPTQPGYYKVKATLSACSINLFSDEIPVSNCPANMDNDLANDNYDLDNDNDGITNCTESLGNQDINISNYASGNIVVGTTYNNSFTGAVTTSALAAATPFVGNSNGSFISTIPAGKSNYLKYTINFNQPINVGLEYVTTANTTDLLNTNAEYIINSDINKTITVLNPNNQLLIDTNYDGIYESGVTIFSSFEIRFRLNSTTPLAAGTGTFKFLSHQASSINFTHKNLSDTLENRSTLKFYALCITKDSDGDNIPDQEDIDSDNDGILDVIEAMGTLVVSISNQDLDNNGIDDSFGMGLVPAINDNDPIPDYLDLDSDNDGIFDLIESGSNAIDTNIDGVVDGNNFGNNGFANALETAIDNGVPNYTIANTDGDVQNNYIDSDSDADNCYDVTEAGYTIVTGGLLGTAPPVVNSNGVVTNAGVYIVPNSNYITSAPINITTQPVNVTVCELQTATFTVIADTVIDSYQWQVSTDGGTTWTNITNNATYSGATTATLTVANVSPAMTNYNYRIFINRNGNACGLYSNSAILTTYALPVVNTPITLKQCDDDTDAISTFNLIENNPFISANYTTETFSYFTTFAAADTNDTTFQITNPVVFTTANTTVYVRVVNVNGCYSVATLNLIVSVTQIPSTFHRTFTKCDDYIDATNNNYDGIATFDFSIINADIAGYIPNSNYTVTYYKNQADALSEINAITNISNYRNLGYPNTQQIWVRVDSNVDNSCFGLGAYATLVVERTPVFNTVGTNNVIRACDDDHDGIFSFNTSMLSNNILQGQTNIDVTYFDDLGNSIPSINPLVVNGTKTITVRLTNNPSLALDGACFVEGTIQFIVDAKPEAYAVTTNLTTCDDETNNPLLQNGSYPFNTTTLQNEILQGQTGMNVTYTLANGTVYTNGLPNPFNSGTQDVLVTVSNQLNSSCTATTVLHFVVNPLPNIDLNQDGSDNEIVCNNLPNLSVTLNAGVVNILPSSYTYQWYLNNTIINGATQYSITVTTAGTYCVEVTTPLGCKLTRVIQVVASEIAQIQNINIIDLSEVNSIEVIATGIVANYEYSLDDIDGPYQDSNLFTNVSMGFHTVYVRDTKGCGIAYEYVSVLGAPHFFTPNGDGYNDTWYIKGASQTFHKNLIVHIFDRYGKLIKQISPVTGGWDGTYNGQMLPSDDYWYVIKVDDGRIVKGHFSLKR